MSSKDCKKKCDPLKICNPQSGRCVLKSGKLGQLLTPKKSRSRDKSSSKISSKNRCPAQTKFHEKSSSRKHLAKESRILTLKSPKQGDIESVSGQEIRKKSSSKKELKTETDLENEMIKIKNNPTLTADSIWKGKIEIYDEGITFTWEVSGKSKLAAVSKAFKRSSEHPNYHYEGEAISIFIEIGRVISIAGFYSIAMLGSSLTDMISNNDRKMLKGLAHSSLCFLLSFLSREQKLPSEIRLDAQGIMKGKKTEGLFQYYKSIGFEFSDPDKVNKLIREGDAVPMKSALKKFIGYCQNKVKHKSEDILPLIVIIREED